MRVQQDLGVVYLFPAGIRKTLCVVAKPEKDSAFVDSIEKHLTDHAERKPQSLPGGVSEAAYIHAYVHAPPTQGAPSDK